MSDSGIPTSGEIHAEGDTLEEAIRKAHAGAEAQHNIGPDEMLAVEVVSLGYRGPGFASPPRFTVAVKPLR